MYFGVQMYGVSKEWKQDPEGFLKKIYEAGYRQIEPCPRQTHEWLATANSIFFYFLSF